MAVLRSVRNRICLWAVAVAAAAPGLFAQPSREYDLKAAFLYNFAAFVDWPPQAFSSDDAPFVIGVLGYDPFGGALDQIVSGERAKGRPIIVRRLQALEQVRSCHILFISASERYRIYEILRYARGRALLTVSDVPNFTGVGGMVGFETEGNRIILNVNMAAVQSAELVVSSKLLRVARVTGEVRP